MRKHHLFSALIIIRYQTMQDKKTQLSLCSDYLSISNDAGEEKQILVLNVNSNYLFDRMFSLVFMY